MFTREAFNVTFKEIDASRIPDGLLEGATWLTPLHRRGVVDEAGKKLMIRRQGGFAALDIWLTLLLYFASGATVGIKKYWERLRPHQHAIAALAGRRALPSPASVSRALNAVETDLLRKQTLWLLTGVTDAAVVMKHGCDLNPSVKSTLPSAG